MTAAATTVEKGMGWARPWATASVVAAAVDAASNNNSAAPSAAAIAAAAKELRLPPSPGPLSLAAAPFVPGTVDGRPYGILVAPWEQEEEASGAGTGGGIEAAAAEGKRKTKTKTVRRGFAVAAIFDVGSTQLLDEEPTSDCFSRCAQWDNPGERAALPLDFSKKILG